MRDRNLVILSGFLASEVRQNTTKDGINQADFKLKHIAKDFDGKIHEQEFLCRVLGKTASSLFDAQKDAVVSLEGQCRTSPSRHTYIESWSAQVYP